MQNFYSGLLSGYSYQGSPAAVAVEIRVGVIYPYRCATIYLYENGEPVPVAEHEFKSRYAGYQWLSRNLDGKPKIFGGFSLTEKEQLRAINGEGAEHFVMSVLMLDYGMLVSQADRSMPGYDLTVEHPGTKRRCRLQVKFSSTVTWPATKRAAYFDFLVVVTPTPVLDGAQSQRKFTAFVVPAGDVHSQSGKAARRSALRDSAYEWAWDSVVNYLLDS